MNRKKLIIALTFVCALALVLLSVSACNSSEASLKVTVLQNAAVTESDGSDAIKQFIKVEYVKPNGESSEVSDYILQGDVKAGKCEFTAVYGAVSSKFTIDVTITEQKLTESEGLKFVLVGGTYEVDDIGFCKDRDIVIPAEYNGKPVTGIAKNAFRDCAEVTSVNVGINVSKIGECAFKNCSRIKTVTLPQSVSQIDADAFVECDMLEKSYYKGGIDDWCKITFANAYANPMYSAAKFYFDKNELAGELVIPETVTAVGDYAFTGYDGVTKIRISEGVKEIGKSAFAYMRGVLSVVMADGAEKVGDYAFYGCSELTGINFSKKTQKMTVGQSVLADCNKLQALTVNFIGSDKSNPVKENAYLGYYFGAYNNTTYSVIPDTLQRVVVTEETEVGDFAFYHANSLVSVTYADGITAIGDSAFFECGNLQTIHKLEGGVYADGALDQLKSIGERAFYYCVKLDLAQIPATVQSIGNYAFSGSGITQIEIKNNISVLSEGIFKDCTKLTKAVLSDSVTEIGARAFQNCSHLTEISLPQNVNKIGEFAMCSGIITIRYAGSTEQWQQINFDEDWNGNSWSDSHPRQVICSDGTVTL